jgi:hypothetical protein
MAACDSLFGRKPSHGSEGSNAGRPLKHFATVQLPLHNGLIMFDFHFNFSLLANLRLCTSSH